MSRPRKSEPRRLGGAVHRVLAELGHGAETPAMRLLRCWPEVVGEALADHCEPVDLRGPVLDVAVPSPAWAQQVQLQKPRILAGLRERLGAEAPAELRCQVRTAPDDGSVG